ncbi:nicotinate-nucleotide pyrophosphorylase [carboxylating] [Arenicella chitinivorans]|uniref:Probable nicotinate-nucleotide pyrophosphorylase [carboxylating] n=1 Tax=Arenicella chitinivorans TaxID=1329800 RepID=A0A918VMF6_9GAMM|nr:carboxylating nicotinate-nucleotide diphosphorylase [Arenicella chitinivorans]GHA07739.1 nicotinate-nucleotide pyrophosphorylase [carboxylating] [Arenicella chitinivorans]
MSHPLPDRKVIKRLVKYALQEDIGSGDLTARLTPKKSEIDGKIITRELGVVCGTAWVDEVFRKVGKRHKTKIEIDWKVQDGDQVEPNQTLCRFEGFAHPILSGERTALNILQTLSGTATITRQYADAIAHTKARLLDTRKTLPMMREAQKYAVLCGGGVNHRMGLYDGIIIKENHLRSGKSLERIVADAIASMPSGTLVELEVETIEELERGLHAGAKRIMLDDFTLDDMREAVALTGDQADLEASGGVTLDTIAKIAETGVDYISSGSITKHVRALDLSMLFDYR